MRYLLPVLLLFVLVAALHAQERTAASDQVNAWITELSSEDESVSSAARDALVAHADESREPLERRFSELAGKVGSDSFLELISIMAVFRAMGLDAAPSLGFLTTAVDGIGGAAWKAWGKRDSRARGKSWNALWHEMVRAIGSTGREALAGLIDELRQNGATATGVPYDQILWCAVPTGDESLRAIVEFAFDEDPLVAKWGGNLVAHADGDVGSLLEPRLSHADAPVRSHALRLMGRAVPNGVFALSRACTHEDAGVRHLALALIASWSNTSLLDPHSSEWNSYVTGTGSSTRTARSPAAQSRH